MSKTALLESIIIKDNRQRQEFDPVKLDELRDSIELNGLLHAPVMRDYLGELVLVAGETRMKAIQDLWALGGTLRYNGQEIPEGRIPYVTLGELSELEAEEAELDENLKRKDLTWQEHAAAIQRLHKLRQNQNEQRHQEETALAIKESRAAPEAKIQTVAATAQEVLGRSDGSYQDLIRKEILVAQHLDNPTVQKAKSVDEAFKILKRQEEQKKNLALAASVGATFNADLHKLYNVNCLHWMAEPSNQGQFDVILTDPPYGMGADSFGDGAGRLAGIEHHYDDSPEAFHTLMEQWCKLSFAMAKPQAHAYVFCDIEHFTWLRAQMRAAGWYVFRTPFVVFKTNSGRVPLPDRGPRRQYEILLYAIKGEKPVTHIYPDVITSQADENMSHGAQKPVAVYQNLLQRSVRPGDTVLDCFAGSGTIFPAAHTFKCKAVGLEMNPEYFGMGLKRIQDLQVTDALGA